MHISKVWAPATCDGAGGSSASVIYDFVLPGDIEKQTFPIRLSKHLDFDVAGKSDDRLAVTVGEEQLGETGWAWITSASTEMVLADGRSLRTEEFVLMNSTEIDHVVHLAAEDAQHTDEWGIDRMRCIQNSIRMLEDTEKSPGAHSPSIRILLDRLKEIGYTAESLPTRTPQTPGRGAANPSDTNVDPYLNTWVAQLASLPEATTTPAQLQATIAELERQTGSTVQSRPSSVYRSLTPGYRVLFHPGGFANGHAALLFCTSHGITDERHCAGRYFSSSEKDISLNCHFRDPPQSTTCIRQ